MVVDLPAPLGPIYPTTSPSSTEIFTFSTATFSSYVREKSAPTAPASPSPRTTERNVFRRARVWMIGIRERFPGATKPPGASATVGSRLHFLRKRSGLRGRETTPGELSFTERMSSRCLLPEGGEVSWPQRKKQ